VTSIFAVPTIVRGQLVSVETVAETAVEAVARAAADNPSASAIAGPASPTVTVTQAKTLHGHRWPPT
jgi:hypothetical protein